MPFKPCVAKFSHYGKWNSGRQKSNRNNDNRTSDCQ